MILCQEGMGKATVVCQQADRGHGTGGVARRIRQTAMILHSLPLLLRGTSYQQKGLEERGSMTLTAMFGPEQVFGQIPISIVPLSRPRKNFLLVKSLIL